MRIQLQFYIDKLNKFIKMESLLTMPVDTDMEDDVRFKGERNDATNEYPDEREPLVQKQGSIRTFDDALDSQGVGLFHVLLILVAGWALASDSVEVQCVSFVTPQLSDNDTNPDKDMHLSDVS